MTDNTPFRVVLRGYEPSQVDQRLAELAHQAQASAARADELAERVRVLEEQAAQPAAEVPATFDHLGQRVGKILTLAEAEAWDLLERGRSALEDERSTVADEVARQRSEADQHAEDRRADAETQAARLIEDARRTADDRLDAAERDAAARLQEAEAVYEQQRAKAAQAAADFETTFARRRDLAEADHATQMQEAQQRLAELEAHIERTRTDAEKMHDEALRENRRIIEEAEQQAATILGDSRTAAAKVRAESDRELAAAIQRRDSINSQLANVRQMLSTLTGGAGLAMAGVLDDAPDGGPSDDADQVEAAEGATEADGDAEIQASADEHVQDGDQQA